MARQLDMKHLDDGDEEDKHEEEETGTQNPMSDLHWDEDNREKLTALIYEKNIGHFQNIASGEQWQEKEINDFVAFRIYMVEFVPNAVQPLQEHR
ncbi:unnamed protein product [Angiostrongylus costaricensis]|uniref:ChSh domain-containing protein n=1 Tax=Angiostrongylus costaricensis TaxID=334426 RepID=A0A0R3Q0P4_ANGCS|nr:unnamed protein product [Angiostrongylus costaricensis]